MITFIKKLFGLEKPAVAEAKTEAPYKVETPVPEAVVVKNDEILPVSFSEIPVTVATEATVKKQQPKKKPAAVKAPTKPRTPRKPPAK